MFSTTSTTNMMKIHDVGKYWNNKDILPGMVMEEAAEVIKAINKFERFKKSDNAIPFDYRSDIENEIGDLLIILDAYMYINYLSYEQVYDHVREKLEMEKEM